MRFEVRIGEEPFRLALAQAPAWIAGFVLGVLGPERGWYEPIHLRLACTARLVAWAAAAAVAVTVSVVSLTGSGFEVFAGGGTWQSALVAVLEGVIVVSMPLWLMDVFRRRWDHQAAFGRMMSRAACADFVVHQIVLLESVLASRFVPWPPELEYLTVSVLAVGGSFGLGALAVRLPGVVRAEKPAADTSKSEGSRDVDVH